MLRSIIQKRSGFSSEATNKDKSGLEECQGWLSKQNSHGFWQKRYFAAINGFLNYYDNESMSTVLASINLADCKEVKLVDLLSGDFHLIFTSGKTYKLRGPDSRTVTFWCDALEERIEYARQNPPKSAGKSMTSPKFADSDDFDNDRRNKSGKVEKGGKVVVGKKGTLSVAQSDSDSEDMGSRRPVSKRAPMKKGSDDSDDDLGKTHSRSLTNSRNARPGAIGSDSDSDDFSRPVKSKRPSSVSASGTGLVASRSSTSSRRPANKSEDDSDDSNDSAGPSYARGAAHGAAAGATRGGSARGAARGSLRVPASNVGDSDSDNSADSIPHKPGKRATSARKDSDSDSGSESELEASITRRQKPTVSSSSRTTTKSNGRKLKLYPPGAPDNAELTVSHFGRVTRRTCSRFTTEVPRILMLADGVLFVLAAVPKKPVVPLDFLGAYDLGRASYVGPLASSPQHATGGAKSKGEEKEKERVAVGGTPPVDRLTFCVVLDLGSGASSSLEFRAPDDAALREWLSELDSAWQFARRRQGSAAPFTRQEGLDCRDYTPPFSFPKWYASFGQAQEASEEGWAVNTMNMLLASFSQITEDSQRQDDDAVATEGGKKIAISKLSACTAQVVEELLDRAQFLASVPRVDCLAYLLAKMESHFFNVISPLTTGHSPAALSPKQLLQLVDAVDCVLGGVRRAQTYAMSCSTQLLYTEARKKSKRASSSSSSSEMYVNADLSAVKPSPASAMLRETRRMLIEAYMSLLGPKLHTIASKVLEKLSTARSELVQKTLGTRIGTKAPTDLFNLMSELLRGAREGSSANIQRRLLSSVMGEVVFFAREVLTFLMDAWASAPAAVDMDFVIALINDAGTMLDHLEQLQAYFAPALRFSTEESTVLNVLPPGAQVQPGDEWVLQEDEREAEAARENLGAVQHDIPRATGQLLNAGMQLTGVLCDIICADFRAPLRELFSDEWPRGAVVTTIAATVVDYLEECALLMDRYFFKRLGSMVLAHVVEQYLLRLARPETVRDFGPGGKPQTFRGISRKKPLGESQLARIKSDIGELQSCFEPFTDAETRAGLLAPLEEALSFLQLSPELKDLKKPTVEDVRGSALMRAFYAAAAARPHCATHAFLLFTRLLELRDPPKQLRAVLRTCAEQALLTHGRPPEDDDDLLALGNAAGMHRARGAGAAQQVGVMNGSSMSQGIEWTSPHIVEAIMRGCFPEAPQEARRLFADWTPQLPAFVDNGNAKEPASFSLSAFTGESTASNKGAHSPRGARGAARNAHRRQDSSDSEEDEVVGRRAPPRGRNAQNSDDDDDDDDDDAPSFSHTQRRAPPPPSSSEDEEEVLPRRQPSRESFARSTPKANTSRGIASKPNNVVPRNTNQRGFHDSDSDSDGPVLKRNPVPARGPPPRRRNDSDSD